MSALPSVTTPPARRCLMSRLACCLLIVPVLCANAVRAAEKPATPIFEEQVRPILRAYCFDCHGEGEKLKADLDVRLNRLILKGGKSGPAVTPGKPESSLLYQRVRAAEMPP